MAIPRQVASQGESAEKIRKGVYEEGKTPEDIGLKVASPGEAPVTDPPIPGKGDPPDPNKGKDSLMDDYKKKYEDLQHQFDVLKGKNDSEVPELVSVNRMMAGQMTALQTQISELQSKLKPADETTLSKPDPKQAEDLQSFTDNYPEIERGVGAYMKRWATSDEFRGMVKTVVEEVVKGVSTRVEQVEKRVEKSAEDTFGEKLDRLVKDDKGNPVWRQINDNPEFTKYLKDKKYHGVSDFDLLRNALARGDAESVAEFFNEHLASKKPPVTKPDNKPIEGDPLKKIVSADDEALAPPKPGAGGKPKAGGDDKDEDKPITRTFVAKFHTDVALGRYKNRPKDRDAINAKINNAMTKGLIVNA